MRVKRFTFTEYRIPFRTPLRTARGNLTIRRGFLIAAHGWNGEIGVGEVATLPEFGTEHHYEAHRALTEIADHHTDQKIPESYQEFPLWHERVGLLTEELPATIYGIECALLALGRAIQKPDLSGRANILEMTTPFSVNSLVTGSCIDELITSARQRWEVGFRTLKLKVGILPAEEDIRTIKLIRMALPNAKIRLDANGFWTAEQAIEFCKHIEHVDIEYIEDPVPSWDVEALAQFREQCRIRVAVDDLVQPCEFLKRSGNQNLFDVLVLKPGRQGSICSIERIQEAASDHGVSVVYTTMFDTSLGLACTLGVMKELADHSIAHGLDTSRLLASDSLIHHLIPDHGKLRVLDLTSLPGMVKEPYRIQLGLPA